jgi:hypothetical protein
LIPLGIVSAAGSSLIPIVSSLSLGISGSYISQGSGNQGFSYTGSGPFSAIHTDILGITNPITVTATLSGYPESGPAYSIDFSNKDILITFTLNGSTIGGPLTTDSNGQATTTFSPTWGGDGGYGWIANIGAQFYGESSGQIIYPSSRSYNANFYSYDVGGAG